MLSFREFTTGHGDFVDETDEGEVKLVPVEGGPETLRGEVLGMVSIWSTSPMTAASKPSVLLEAFANQKVHLIGQYYVRYDPPRKASTGQDAPMRGDWHLFDKSGEIAAWDTEAKARHGFESGTKLPKKAYKALKAQYGDLVGLKSNLLESLQSEDPIPDVAGGLIDTFLMEHPQIDANGMTDAVRQLVATAIQAEREACAKAADRLAAGPTSNRSDLSQTESAALFGFKAGATNAGLVIRQRECGDRAV